MAAKYRTVFQSGRWTRLHMDFWPRVVRNGNLIWGATQHWLLGRREGQPVPTVRLQLIRESLQDFEARLTILQSLAKLPAEAQKAHRILLDDLQRRMGIGRAYLSQMELNHDWLGYVARVCRAAEELSGVKTEASWGNPPK